MAERERTSSLPPPSTRTETGSNLICFDHVAKAFGPKQVYVDLSITVKKGETLTILGGSGSGKSVMLKMLIGLLTADSGTITFDDEDITKMSQDQLVEVRRRIAYLFQSAALFDSMSVGDNVAYGLREQFWNTMSEEEIMERVANALTMVGLPGVEGMRPADLSGGMRKRVGLARTLALQPEVLLYDEPTTGLDPINTGRINNLINSIREGLNMTSLVVTHDMGTAFTVSDRIAVIQKGRILQVGTTEEIRATTDPYIRDFIEGRAPKGEDVATLLAPPA